MFYHITGTEIGKLSSERRGFYNDCDRPRGFWFTEEFKWLEFLLNDGFFLSLNDCFWNNYFYEVDVSKCNLIFIDLSSIDEYNKFYLQYSKNDDKESNINWEKLMSDYDGFYCYNHENFDDKIKLEYSSPNIPNVFFHKSLNIDSGCIWNVEKLGIKKITTEVFKDRYFLEKRKSQMNYKKALLRGL